MKIHRHLRIVSAAAIACGLAVAALADDSKANTLVPAPAAPPVAVATGLLGQTYAGLTYRYINLNDPAGHADDYRFYFNESLRSGLDGRLNLAWTDSSSVRRLALTAGLRAYAPEFTWGKPYAEVDGGYVTEKAGGMKDDSFLWQAGVGVELQVAPATTFTPFVRYENAPSLGGSDRWDFGVKANYWVDRQWAITVGVDRDDHQNTGFMVGTNFRY